MPRPTDFVLADPPILGDPNFAAAAQEFLGDLPAFTAYLRSYADWIESEIYGELPDGTALLPSLSFASDPNTGLYRVAADQIGFVTNGVRRALLSTTAFQVDLPITGAAVQSSATDTDINKLMKVGAFGLGTTAPPNILLNNAVIPGTYSYKFDDPVAPGGGSGVVEVKRTSYGGAILQEATAVAGNGVWRRVSSDTGATWGAWWEVYDAHRILGTVSRSGSLPTGAVIERGSNANGEYVRFADGTQICVSQPISLDISAAFGQGFTAAATASWTYPAAFAAAPAADAQCKSTTNAWGQCTAASFSASINGKSFSNQGARDFTAYAIGRWF